MFKVRLYGDPVLRKIANPIDPTSVSSDFVTKMSETMYVEDGVGLAAPQIGISERVFLYDVGEKLNVVINPEILEKSTEEEIGEEGCLSFPEIFDKVPRSVSIRVRYFDQHGEEYVKKLEGYEARVFQHEFDHLNGKLFIDYLTVVRRRMLKSKLDEIKRKSAEILKAIKASSQN